jgi:hypothetical protein
VTGRRSPGRDPVVVAEQIAVAVLAVIVAAMIAAGIRGAQARAALHCPPQGHPARAQTLNHHQGRGSAARR